MKKVALIGASGFVGSALLKVLEEQGAYELFPVVRENYESYKDEKFDIVINSAMPSKRWWALNNELADFDATVRLTADITYNWNYEKLVLISSVSARVQKEHPYGRHKYLAEKVALLKNPKNLVFRLGGLYGEGLDKGVVFDMINGNEVFMTADSSFNYIDTQVAAKLIVNRLDKSGIVDIGAKDAISIEEIANQFNLSVEFGNRKEFQNTESPDDDYPLASEIIDYIKNLGIVK